MDQVQIDAIEFAESYADQSDWFVDGEHTVCVYLWNDGDFRIEVRCGVGGYDDPENDVQWNSVTHTYQYNHSDQSSYRCIQNRHVDESAQRPVRIIEYECESIDVPEHLTEHAEQNTFE